MSNIGTAYDQWSAQYDTNKNRTRDLEAISLRSALKEHRFEKCLEIGCGTGKNTEWLLIKAAEITAVDLSAGMLAKAKEKITSSQVHFVQADITRDWDFTTGSYDLATFSLVLEHIEDLQDIFSKLSMVMRTGALVYIGELHPFKQYIGTKARFETNEGRQELTCFNHHISEFFKAANKNGFCLQELEEWFDEDNQELPRIISMVFQFK
ncbi:class I SAM-dependent methyltransferase [Flavihumibacter sp. CACIAM 22H1]|uniref:class I SAM-dependent methyltransferase n=1 Tax=Flavihumibacter sp. CACIAM 22H1 TaxID=1812911 RepID=UPI0007A91B39|nr:class I SAM-dependent methyltransferase [Flavihumibacter sp. CACIAM 22H1]KYP13883.1 MAG: methyltransferase type 11 [Flavihumibacter sp. CACIAM 22H1]